MRSVSNGVGSPDELEDDELLDDEVLELLELEDELLEDALLELVEEELLELLEELLELDEEALLELPFPVSPPPQAASTAADSKIKDRGNIFLSPGIACCYGSAKAYIRRGGLSADWFQYEEKGIKNTMKRTSQCAFSAVTRIYEGRLYARRIVGRSIK